MSPSETWLEIRLVAGCFYQTSNDDPIFSHARTFIAMFIADNVEQTQIV